MSDHPNDRFDDLMRRALAEEADKVEPADALPEIQARVRAEGRPASRPWVLTAGAAAVATAAAIGAFTVLDNNTRNAGDSEVAGGPGTTTSASPPPRATTPAPTPTAGTLPSTKATGSVAVPTRPGGTPEPAVKSAVVPVYWLGDKVGAKTGPSVRLYRTFAKVQGRPAVEAVRLMTTARPGDPDYYSLWSGAEVDSVTRHAGVVTIDFKQLPKARLDDAAVADLAAQQLVYTVQGVLQDKSERIQITHQGRAGAKLFGQVDTTRPLSRAQAADVQALVWIVSPTEGQQVGTSLTVTGIAAAFEATVNWRVTNLKTRVSDAGFVNAEEGQTFSPFSIPLKLDPGQWQLEAYLVSAEDGRITDTDSKVVVVK